LLALTPGAASAHSKSLSWSIWTVDGTDVRLYVEVAAIDVVESVPIDSDGDQRLTSIEAEAGRGLTVGLLDGTVEVRNGSVVCRALGPASVEIPRPPERLLLRRSFRCDRAVSDLGVALRLHDAVRASAHRNLASFRLPGDRAAQHVFSAAEPTHRLVVDQPPEQASAWGAFGVYLRLGIEHIVTGFDHLLFLFALLLILPPPRRLLAIVTSFTVAHSITLALAALDVLALPPSLVEPAIALSIAWVGVENLWIREGRHRWLLTFGFGLIHGFGFAGILRELGLPRAHLATSLLSFNLGVELGQVAVVAPLYALVRYGHRTPERYRVRATRAASGLTVGVALVWFVQRVAGA